MALGINASDGGAKLVEIAGVDEGLVARDSQGFEELGEFVFGFEFGAFVGTDAVRKEGERALGGALGIELLEGAGGGVARIGEGGQPGFVALFVHGGEGFIGHEDFTTDF